jgi:glycosyltransferase involved in cell wall biosynthesis
VYATPVGGVPDILVDGETGFLMTEREPAAVADRIEAILSRDDTERITRNAQELIEQEYVFDAAVDRYRHILTEIERNT